MMKTRPNKIAGSESAYRYRAQDYSQHQTRRKFSVITDLTNTKKVR
jgi:hypothetical protein